MTFALHYRAWLISIHTYIYTYIHKYIRNNHTYLIEAIRKRVASLESQAWKLTFSWVKAHVGIYGNELADRLDKEAARSNGTSIAFNWNPESTLYYDATEEAKQKWQDQWTACAKAAITKQFFCNGKGETEGKNKSDPKSGSDAD
jgi:hypothetical protein